MPPAADRPGFKTRNKLSITLIRMHEPHSWPLSAAWGPEGGPSASRRSCLAQPLEWLHVSARGKSGSGWG